MAANRHRGISRQGTGHGSSGLLSHRAPQSTVLLNDPWAEKAENRFSYQSPNRHESPGQAGTEEWLMQRLREEAEAAVNYLAQNLGPGPWIDVTAASSHPFRTPLTTWYTEGRKTRDDYADLLRGSFRYSLSSRDISEMQQALQELHCLPFPTVPPKSDPFFSLLDKVDGLFISGRGRLGVLPKLGGFVVQHTISGACDVPELLSEPSSALESYFSTPDAGLAEKLYDIYIRLTAHVSRARWETRIDVSDLHRSAEQKLADLQMGSQQMKTRSGCQLVASPFLAYFQARVVELETTLECDMDSTLELQFQRQIQDTSQLQFPPTEANAAFAHIAALEHAFRNEADPVCTALALAGDNRGSLDSQYIRGVLKNPLTDIEYVRHPLTTATHAGSLPVSKSQVEFKEQRPKHDTRTGDLTQPLLQNPHQDGRDGTQSLLPSQLVGYHQQVEISPHRFHIKAVHFNNPIDVVLRILPEREDAPTPSSPPHIEDFPCQSEEELSISSEPDERLESEGEGSLFDIQVESDIRGLNATAARAWISTYLKRTQTVLKARRSKDDKRVRIAVLDTGIDLNHPAITKCRTSIVEYHSWVVDDTSISDVCGHGTHIASVLLKLAPWADLYIAKVFKDANDVGNTGVDAVVKAIDHARTQWKVDIISLSFGYRLRKPSIETAIDVCGLTKPPILIFAAAANTGALEDRPAFPGRMRSVFCINSASGDGKAMSYNPPMLRGSFNYTFLGDAITGAWPIARSADHGVIIKNSDKGPERILSGTSLAAPVAASVAAAVLELCRQRPRIPELSDWCVARVQTYDGMQEVFRATMQGPGVHEYTLIQPWGLFDAWEAEEAEDARLAAGRRLALVIQREFGT
ncbi:peptidase S8/S53 domain-containing protein [Rhexocercosporidium sp. MPI-PUGE-AT-0058]|nr:peptidase S8/S53 domain-containing protein [Rhexocercosporidium sp. MPI-PUGE-AT-0058]